MKSIIDLIDVIMWPGVTVLIVWWLRSDISKTLTAITNRIADRSTDVGIGRDGLQLSSKIDSAEAKIASIEADQELIKPLVFDVARSEKSSSEESTQDENQDGIPDLLERMAEDYMNIRLSDYVERVRAKDKMARRMANFVIANEISRDQLSAMHHEGLILALASAIHTFPEKNDVDRLLRVVDEVNRMHVKYRIVLAFGRLVERGYASTHQITNILSVLSNYKNDADSSLVARIDQTLRLIEQKMK